MRNTQLHHLSRERRLIYHLVWGTMRERRVLEGEVADALRRLVHEKAAHLAVEVRRLVILSDHVYLVVEASATVPPHSIVCGVKAYSSGRLRRDYASLLSLPCLWTSHYIVASGLEVSEDDILHIFHQTRPTRRPRGRPISWETACVEERHESQALQREEDRL